MRILLPSAKYKVQMWSREDKSFKDVQYDIIEQMHFTRNNTELKDYMMFINAGVLPTEQLTYLKLIKTKQEKAASRAEQEQTEGDGSAEGSADGAGQA